MKKWTELKVENDRLVLDTNPAVVKKILDNPRKYSRIDRACALLYQAIALYANIKNSNENFVRDFRYHYAVGQINGICNAFMLKYEEKNGFFIVRSRYGWKLLTVATFVGEEEESLDDEEKDN